MRYEQISFRLKLPSYFETDPFPEKQISISH